MTTALAASGKEQSVAVKEYFRSGNVSAMSPDEKDYVLAKLCERYGLDFVLRPFELISFRGVEKFYMTASATNQLAAQKSLSREVLDTTFDLEKGIASCAVRVSDPTGRAETGSAFINISRFVQDASMPSGVRKDVMSGEDLANALAKLETKAKRRVTMAFFGVPDGAMDDEASFAPAGVAPVTTAKIAADVKALSTSPTTPVVEAAPPAEKKTRGKKKAETQAETDELGTIEGEIVAATTSVEVPTSKPAEVATEPEVVEVTYNRTLHAAYLVEAANTVYGSNAWMQDEAKKGAVKNAIPALHGAVAVTSNGVLAPQFVATLKQLVGA